jgi:hypothetical protein
MASTNITSGRVSPIISELLLTAAQGNAGRYLAGMLPCNFQLASGSLFKGDLRTLPTAQIFGDARAVGTGILKRQAGSEYHDLSRARAFSTVSYECIERAARVFVDDQDLARTSDSAIAGLNMRQSRALQLVSGLLDDLEYDCLAAVFNTTNFQNAAVGALTGGAGVAWNAAGSSPSRDGVAVQNLIRAQAGGQADYAVLTWDVAQALRYHPETINVSRVTSGAASVSTTVRTMDETLALWAERWELPLGVFVVKALYNSANPANTASLAEFQTGKAAFHCAAGLKGAVQVQDNVDIAGGLVSLVNLQESGYRGYEDPQTNPHGIQLAAKHSYAYTAAGASAATRPAYIITGVV